MNIEPIPGELTRFFVQSSSRPAIQHIVDMDYEGKPCCSCEDHQVRGKACKHILAVRQWAKEKVAEYDKANSRPNRYG